MNNQFYPQYNNPYQAPYQAQTRMNSNGITWVQGIEGAKAYQIIPNSNILLMDSENDGVFYIKVSDNVGMCSLRTFKYEEVTNVRKTQDAVDLSQYITRDELNDILNSRFERGKNNGKPTLQSVKSESATTDDK